MRRRRQSTSSSWGDCRTTAILNEDPLAQALNSSELKCWHAENCRRPSVPLRSEEPVCRSEGYADEDADPDPGLALWPPLDRSTTLWSPPCLRLARDHFGYRRDYGHDIGTEGRVKLKN